MTPYLADFFLGSWFTWAIPIAAALIVWTFVFVVFGGRTEDE